MVGRLGLLSLVAVLLVPLRASAQPAVQRTAFLRWARPADAEECITEEALAHAVVGRLKRPVWVTEAKADVIIEARVERRRAPAAGWHAVIALSTAGGSALGTREIQSKDASCSSINNSLVLVISLLIDPDAALGFSSPGPPAPPPAPPAKAPVPEAPLPEPPKPPAIAPKPTAKPPPPAGPAPRIPAARWRFDAQGGMIFALGLLPGVGAGFLLRDTLTPPRFWGVQVDGAVWLRSEARVGAAGSSFSLAYIGGALCPLAGRFAILRLDACAGMKIGKIQAQGFGFDSPEYQQGLVFNLAAEGHARLRPIGPLVISLGLGLGVPLSRTRFVFTQRNAAGQVLQTIDLFRVSPVIGALDAGIGIEVP